jgi:hypothetical protein
MLTRRQFVSRSLATGLATSMTFGASVAQADELWAEKMFEKTTHDFGVVARGADSSYRLKLKNLYNETVHIAEVRTTCGCSAGKPSQETLQSLEEAYVEITMDTRKFTRRKDSNVIVVFDQPSYQEVRIPITAYIRTDVVIDPGSAQFGSIDREQKNERTLKIAYAGREDWKIKEVQTGSKLVDAVVKEASRGGGRVNYDLTVTLSDKVPFGPFRHSITLLTDDENSPKVPLLVEAEVTPDIVVNPSIVALGTMTPGQEKTVNVVLRGKKAFEVSAVNCVEAKDVFQVRLPTTAAPIQIIPLTVTAPQKTGKLDEQISVTILGRTDPVTFRAYGRIALAGS